MQCGVYVQPVFVAKQSLNHRLRQVHMSTGDRNRYANGPSTFRDITLTVIHCNVAPVVDERVAPDACFLLK